MSEAAPDDALAALARAHHVYQQQALKERLREAAPVTLAFERYREAMHWPASARLRTLPLLGLREAAIASGLSFREFEPGGARFEMPAPTVLGEGNQRPLQARRRARYLACLGPARIVSRGASLVLEDGIAIDAEPEERLAIHDRLDLDPAIFASDGNLAQVIERDDVPCIDVPEAFVLAGTHSWAFGHWMWESLPRYVGATLDDLPPMPVLVDAGMPPQHRQALDAMLAPGASVVELPTGAQAQVARAWVAPTPMYMPQFEHMDARFDWGWLAAEPRDFARLVAEMNRRVPTPVHADAPRRLFLARRELRHRKLVNSAQIEAIAGERGFARLYPEDLDFAAQVASVRAADHLVGPEGSAFFLCFFARPGTRVDILNHPYTLGLAVLTGLLEALGLRVRVLTGPATSEHPALPHFVDYRIDPERFADLLDERLGA